MSNRRGIGRQRLLRRLSVHTLTRLEDIRAFDCAVRGWQPPRMDRRRVKREKRLAREQRAMAGMREGFSRCGAHAHAASESLAVLAAHLSTLGIAVHQLFDATRPGCLPLGVLDGG